MNSTNIKQADRLTPEQIGRFKRDGFIVLPGVIDSELCIQAREKMWTTIAEHLPRLKQDDPSTWQPITEEESTMLAGTKPQSGGDPYFSGSKHRFYVRNGTEEHMLDIAPRAMWQIAEQLLGQETIVWPAGHDETGMTRGPCFLCDDAIGNLSSHVDHHFDWPKEGTFKTEDLTIPRTGPVWVNGQGTRGLYCTLPNSPAHTSDYRGAHSDGACYNRFRLQMSVYIDDLPPNCGGFTVWPGSHTRIWPEQWKAFYEGEKHTDKHLAVRKAGGYTDPVIREIKADTKPVDCYGPTGTVVLWHTKILHIAGENRSDDVIRQATIYGFLKTRKSVPDELVINNTDGNIWRDWSNEVRTIDERATT